MTALAAAGDGLEHGMLEAAALLAEGAPAVLLVVTEEQPPEAYSAWIDDVPFPYAVGLLITPGNDWRLTLNSARMQSSKARWALTLDLLCSPARSATCQHAGKNRVIDTMATRPVTEKNRDAYYGGCWPRPRALPCSGSVACACAWWFSRCWPACRVMPRTHRLRARKTVSRCFWLFVRFMARTGVLDLRDSRRRQIRATGPDDHRQSSIADDVVFLMGCSPTPTAWSSKALGEPRSLAPPCAAPIHQQQRQHRHARCRRRCAQTRPAPDHLSRRHPHPAGPGTRLSSGGRGNCPAGAEILTPW